MDDAAPGKGPLEELEALGGTACWAGTALQRVLFSAVAECSPKNQPRSSCRSNPAAHRLNATMSALAAKASQRALRLLDLREPKHSNILLTASLVAVPCVREIRAISLLLRPSLGRFRLRPQRADVARKAMRGSTTNVLVTALYVNTGYNVVFITISTAATRSPLCNSYTNKLFCRFPELLIIKPTRYFSRLWKLKHQHDAKSGREQKRKKHGRSARCDKDVSICSLSNRARRTAWSALFLELLLVKAVFCSVHNFAYSAIRTSTS